jgi:hypothetical protein
MPTRSSSREKTFFLGIILALGAICGLAIPNLSGVVRIAAGCCLAFGVLLYKGAFFVGAWSNGPIGKIQKSPNGYLWLKIVAVVLWLGVTPLTFLWLYDHLHRH